MNTRKEQKKEVRLITEDGVVELTGTPEELSKEILKRYKTNVIQFPARGIYAHPSNPNWGK